MTEAISRDAPHMSLGPALRDATFLVSANPLRSSDRLKEVRGCLLFREPLPNEAVAPRGKL
jgi:hypothetical protein